VPALRSVGHDEPANLSYPVAVGPTAAVLTLVAGPVTDYGFLRDTPSSAHHQCRHEHEGGERGATAMSRTCAGHRSRGRLWHGLQPSPLSAHGDESRGCRSFEHVSETRAKADRSIVEARLDTARAHTRAGRHLDAVEELRRAVQEDPLTARTHLDLAFAAARVGDLAAARAGWEHFIRMSPRDPMATLVHRALGALAEFERALEVHANG